MLLVIDIGNTDTTLGVFKGEELKSTGYMATAIHRTADEYATLVLTILHHKNIHASDIDDIVLCSVVPPLTATYEQLCQQYFNISPLVTKAVPDHPNIPRINAIIVNPNPFTINIEKTLENIRISIRTRI